MDKNKRIKIKNTRHQKKKVKCREIVKFRNRRKGVFKIYKKKIFKKPKIGVKGTKMI
jgi:hypothetical protein